MYATELFAHNFSADKPIITTNLITTFVTVIGICAANSTTFCTEHGDHLQTIIKSLL